MSQTETYAQTFLPHGIESIFDICELLRGRNIDGYMQGQTSFLANIKNGNKVCTATTCSPFTGTVIGVAFDPTFPRNDWPKWPELPKGRTNVNVGDPYVPMFNGGKDELPFSKFYSLHNGNSPVGSIVKYNLGWEIHKQRWGEIRRGDLIAVDWYPKRMVKNKKGDLVERLSGGHVVFCWDVHTNKEGRTDCMQLIGSNGTQKGGYGVSIIGCGGKKWFDGHLAENGKLGTGSLEKSKDWMNKKGRLFVHDDEIVRSGYWYALPGVKKGDIDFSTFRTPVPAGHVLFSDEKRHSIGILRVARFHYHDDPPKPFCMKDGAPAPKQATPIAHVDGPVTPVRGPNVKSDPEAPKKVTPKTATQEKKKPLKWQLYVEQAMLQFYRAEWIASDPGEPDEINDPKTQAAIKEFQRKFDLDDDGIQGPLTRAVVFKQLPACRQESTAQILLGSLYRGKKLTHDPGPPDGVNNPQTHAAVEEFQGANGLEVTGLPDADTLAKLIEVHESFKATSEKPGLEPTIRHIYWVVSPVAPGGSAKLRIHFRDLVNGQDCPIYLIDEESGKEIESGVKMRVDNEEAEASVPIPTDFGAGSRLKARITAALEGEGELEATTPTPLLIEAMGQPVLESADWRPYIGQEEVPATILEIIRKNRAKYPMKKVTIQRPYKRGQELFLITDPKDKYHGEHHYDYKPGLAHEKWAKGWIQKKIDAVASGGQRVESHIASAFKGMLDHEGLPASLQTYDNQIVTWGVGLGAKGDGKHAFTHLNKDPKMKRLLDDLGVNFDHSTVAYHVVHLGKKKVISSRAPIKAKKETLGDDIRHIVALQAWREQTDLHSAIIGVSEDPATRDAVMESQWAVYLSNSTRWSGQDKVFSLALFFMITHMFHWLPAVGKGGIYVNREYEAIAGGSPSFETDKKIAPRIARSYVAYAKVYAETPYAKKNHFSYENTRKITKEHIWRDFRSEAKKEGFDPGELIYEDE